MYDAAYGLRPGRNKDGRARRITLGS